MAEIVPRQVLSDMIRYYRDRAGEYDQWFYRQGRYDRGEENNRRWFAEVHEVEVALDDFALEGEVLELACGTGIWTQRLIKRAASITGVDASPEVIQINRQRVGDDRVNYVQADLFDWRPERRYDAVFFGFWLCHVPMERLSDFWSTVAAALRPGGKVFFVDSRREPTSTAKDHQLPDDESQVLKRRLGDGREFTIVKNFYDQPAVAGAAVKAGIELDVRATPTYFIHGAGIKANK